MTEDKLPILATPAVRRGGCIPPMKPNLATGMLGNMVLLNFHLMDINKRGGWTAITIFSILFCCHCFIKTHPLLQSLQFIQLIMENNNNLWWKKGGRELIPTSKRGRFILWPQPCSRWLTLMDKLIVDLDHWYNTTINQCLHPNHHHYICVDVKPK